MTIGMPPPAREPAPETRETPIVSVPVDPTPATPGVPAGWYHDPGSGRMRYWDGARWTEQFAAATAKVSNLPAGFAFGASILALVTGFFVIPGIIFGVTGIILGIAGVIRSNKTNTGLGFAVAGTIISIVVTVVLVIGAVIVLTSQHG